MNRNSGVKTVIIERADLLDLSNEELRDKIIDEMEKPFVFFYFSDKGDHLVITTEKGIVKDFPTYLRLTKADYRSDKNRFKDVSLGWFPYTITDLKVLRILHKSIKSENATMMEIEDLIDVIKEWRNPTKKDEPEEPVHLNTINRDKDPEPHIRSEKTTIPWVGDHGMTMQYNTPKAASKYDGAISAYKIAKKKTAVVITDSGSHKPVEDIEDLEKRSKIVLFAENLRKFDTKDWIEHLKKMLGEFMIYPSRGTRHEDLGKDTTKVKPRSEDYDTIIKHIEKFLSDMKKNAEFEYNQMKR